MAYAIRRRVTEYYLCYDDVFYGDYTKFVVAGISYKHPQQTNKLVCHLPMSDMTIFVQKGLKHVSG